MNKNNQGLFPNQTKMKNKTVLLALLMIVLAGIALRFSPILSQRDFWYDEAFTGVLIKAPFGEMNQMIFEDVHPPLYYWLVKPWSVMFDYSPIGIRSFSVLMGIATILSLFWIGGKMFGTRAGLLAASFVSFSPFAVQYSQEARMYSLFGLLFVWSVWFFLQALKTKKRKYFLFWGLLSGLAFYTHYLALFFFVLFYVTYVVYRLTINKEKLFKALFCERGFWYGVGIIAIFFGSWIKIFVDHAMKGNLGWIGVSYLSDLAKTLQIFFFGHPPGTGGVPSPNGFRTIDVGKNDIRQVVIFDEFSVGLVLLVAVAVFVAILWGKSRFKKEILVLVLMSFGTLVFLIALSFVNIKLYVARYFIPAAVLIYLLTAGVFVNAFKSRYIWVIILAMYVGLMSLLAPIEYDSGWDMLAKERDKYLNSETIIVASNPFDYTTARYYFGKERTRFYNRGNPEESFSWVLVKDEDKINTLAELKTMNNMKIVDNSCDWEGLELEKEAVLDQLSVCSVK